jgi:Integrase core domain
MAFSAVRRGSATNVATGAAVVGIINEVNALIPTQHLARGTHLTRPLIAIRGRLGTDVAALAAVPGVPSQERADPVAVVGPFGAGVLATAVDAGDVLVRTGLVGEDGKRRRPWLFRIVLSCSRKAYNEVVWRQTTDNVIAAIEYAFHYFGGVPRRLVIDNLKAEVGKPGQSTRVSAYDTQRGDTVGDTLSDTLGVLLDGRGQAVGES